MWKTEVGGVGEGACPSPEEDWRGQAFAGWSRGWIWPSCQWARQSSELWPPCQGAIAHSNSLHEQWVAPCRARHWPATIKQQLSGQGTGPSAICSAAPSRQKMRDKRILASFRERVVMPPRLGSRLLSAPDLQAISPFTRQRPTNPGILRRFRENKGKGPPPLKS